MKPIKIVNFQLPIIFLKILEDNRILTIDTHTNIRLLEQENLKLSAGIKGEIIHEEYKQKVVALSSDFRYFISLHKNNRESLFINLKNKKAFAKFHRHQGEVSVLAIDPLNRYLFSCGDDGKVFALHIENAKLAFLLPMHKDRVNDIAFSSDGNWCTTVSYDKKTTVFNLSTMQAIYTLNFHNSPIMKTHFIDDAKAISIDKKSKAIVFHIYSGEKIAILDGIHDDVTALCSNEKFLFIATALGYIILYELKEYKLLSKQFIKIDSYITHLEFNKQSNTLFLATANGDILSYDIYLGEKDLRDALQKKEYHSIQTILKKNPLLTYTSAYTRFHNIWEETLKKAKEALEKGNQKRVDELFKNFKHIPSKNRIIQELEESYKDFEKFRVLIKHGKISLAYNMLNKYPLYKNTKTYQKLESQWQKSFLDAQMALTESRGIEKANEILKPYKGITEKTLPIQSLLKEHLIYNQFKKSLLKEEFKRVFEYLKIHPFLKEFPEYQQLIEFANTLHKKALRFIEKKELHTALKLLTKLEDFPEFKEEVKDRISTLKIDYTFANSFQNKNLQLAYKILDKNFHLYKSPEGELLQKEWKKDIEEANTLALHAKTQELNHLLKKYFEIPSRYTSLSHIYANCYIVELEKAIQSKQSRATIEKGIQKYITIFGLNNQIENFYTISKKHYKDMHLELKNIASKETPFWRPTLIVESIF